MSGNSNQSFGEVEDLTASVPTRHTSGTHSIDGHEPHSTGYEDETVPGIASHFGDDEEAASEEAGDDQSPEEVDSDGDDDASAESDNVSDSEYGGPFHNSNLDELSAEWAALAEKNHDKKRRIVALQKIVKRLEDQQQRDQQELKRLKGLQHGANSSRKTTIVSKPCHLEIL